VIFCAILTKKKKSWPSWLFLNSSLLRDPTPNSQESVHLLTPPSRRQGLQNWPQAAEAPRCCKALVRHSPPLRQRPSARRRWAGRSPDSSPRRTSKTVSVPSIPEISPRLTASRPLAGDFFDFGFGFRTTGFYVRLFGSRDEPPLDIIELTNI
jgi:hypothetical protein